MCFIVANKILTFHVNLSRNKFIFKWNELHAVCKSLSFSPCFSLGTDDKRLGTYGASNVVQRDVVEQFILESNISLPIMLVLINVEKDSHFPKSLDQTPSLNCYSLIKIVSWGHFRGIQKTSINLHLFSSRTLTPKFILNQQQKGE